MKIEDWYYAALAEFLSLINNLIVQMLKFRFKFDKMSINDKTNTQCSRDPSLTTAELS